MTEHLDFGPDSRSPVTPPSATPSLVTPSLVGTSLVGSPPDSPPLGSSPPVDSPNSPTEGPGLVAAAEVVLGPVLSGPLRSGCLELRGIPAGQGIRVGFVSTLAAAAVLIVLTATLPLLRGLGELGVWSADELSPPLTMPVIVALVALLAAALVVAAFGAAALRWWRRARAAAWWEFPVVLGVVTGAMGAGLSTGPIADDPAQLFGWLSLVVPLAAPVLVVAVASLGRLVAGLVVRIVASASGAISRQPAQASPPMAPWWLWWGLVCAGFAQFVLPLWWSGPGVAVPHELSGRDADGSGWAMSIGASLLGGAGTTAALMVTVGPLWWWARRNAADRGRPERGVTEIATGAGPSMLPIGLIVGIGVGVEAFGRWANPEWWSESIVWPSLASALVLYGLAVGAAARGRAVPAVIAASAAVMITADRLGLLSGSLGDLGAFLLAWIAVLVGGAVALVAGRWDGSAGVRLTTAMALVVVGGLLSGQSVIGPGGIAVAGLLWWACTGMWWTRVAGVARHARTLVGAGSVLLGAMALTISLATGGPAGAPDLALSPYLRLGSLLVVAVGAAVFVAALIGPMGVGRQTDRRTAASSGR